MTNDKFLNRLNELLSNVKPDQREQMFLRAGEMDAKMRRNGQLRAEWKCKVSELDLLGTTVVAPTEYGERIGTAVCFGIHQDGAHFERSVFVHIPYSGTIFEAPGSSVRIAASYDLEKQNREHEMAATLENIEKSSVDNKKKKQRSKIKKDPELTQKLLDYAVDAGLEVEELKTFWRIFGPRSDRKIYLSTNNLICNLSGFNIEHEAVEKISEQQAKEQHLGAVRGTIHFDNIDLAIDAFVTALAQLV